MTDGTLNNPTPQFGTAEYIGKAGNDHCQFCHLPIAGQYYRAQDAMACPGCAEKMRGELAKDSHAAYVRAILFGVGAAIAGLILYATFAIVTGIVIGYISLAVGWMVGKAMLKGSNGVGGRRYQIVAVLLTYIAVSMGRVPVWIHYAQEHPQPTQQQKLEAEQRQLEAESGQKSQASESPAEPQVSRVAALEQLGMLALTFPFTRFAENPLGGAIGLVILFVGVSIAWRLTEGKPLEIHGPFESSGPGPR